MVPLANGISIPSSYTAYLAPLSSSKLYNEVRAGKDDNKASETPYVVMFQAVNILSGQGGDHGGRCGSQIQECWEFEHPRRDVVLDERGKCFQLSRPARWLVRRLSIP
jgi:protein arginine N-methyltransferase 5